MKRELLFSVTEADCKFDYYRGSGKGGQKKNKTSSAVRCTHKDSGAVGQSEDTRNQHQNKAIAFKRMAESDKFLNWHKIETARITGKLAEAEESTEKAMLPHNIKVEVKNDKGLWSETEDRADD